MNSESMRGIRPVIHGLRIPQLGTGGDCAVSQFSEFLKTPSSGKNRLLHIRTIFMLLIKCQEEIFYWFQATMEVCCADREVIGPIRLYATAASQLLMFSCDLSIIR